jgi:hypothetical protein
MHCQGNVNQLRTKSRRNILAVFMEEKTQNPFGVTRKPASPTCPDTRTDIKTFGPSLVPVVARPHDEGHLRQRLHGRAQREGRCCGSGWSSAESDMILGLSKAFFERKLRNSDLSSASESWNFWGRCRRPNLCAPRIKSSYFICTYLLGICAYREPVESNCLSPVGRAR